MNKTLYSLMTAFLLVQSPLLMGVGATVNFTQVAKSGIPAVVSVKVKTPVDKSASNGNPYDPQNPLAPFQDEFFQHFFGIPRREEPRNTQPSISQGSGFFVSSDGYLLTNNHVVSRGGEITILTKEGREFKAEIIGRDENSDIAVLKIEGKDLPFLKLGDSNALEVAQPVLAIGNPLGLQASVTSGIVSAKGRSGLSLANWEDFIQTDAAINRGNSGGPLLNLDGEVIGINTAIVSSNMGGGYMGIGFAIPSNMASYVMGQLIDTGKVTRGFLGVTLQQIDNDLAQAFELEDVAGALVTDTSTDSPAEKAGLKQGDIITKYNGKPVTTIASLRNAVAMLEPGTRINLIVLRSGESIEIPVEVGTYPESGFESPTTNKLGISVKQLTSDLAKTLGITDEKGVVVTEVNPDSDAYQAGVRKGGLILAVNQKEVNDVEAFHKALKETPEGRPVLLLVKQGNVTRFLSLKIK